MCVERPHQGEDVVATVHGDNITIGGQRTAVEFHIKMISRKYEIKKQVIGEDPDFEKSGRILNRVIEWDRDGITIVADQRHVREILKGLELVRANHSATPCAVERRDESNGQNRCGRGQTKSKHILDDVNDDDDEKTNRRWQMTMPLTVRHSLQESVTCRKIAQISRSH